MKKADLKALPEEITHRCKSAIFEVFPMQHVLKTKKFLKITIDVILYSLMLIF